MEAPLHLSEAQTGVLLVPPDSLQLFLAVLLGDAGALLPLLYALREDLINAAVDDKNCPGLRSSLLNFFFTCSRLKRVDIFNAARQLLNLQRKHENRTEEEMSGISLPAPNNSL